MYIHTTCHIAKIIHVKYITYTLIQFMLYIFCHIRHRVSRAALGGILAQEKVLWEDGLRPRFAVNHRFIAGAGRWLDF